MAKNLRKGLGRETTLLICDVNSEALTRFRAETAEEGPVEIISNGYEAAKAAVRQDALSGQPREEQGETGNRADFVCSECGHHHATRV